jgi:hypothetical protein
LGDERLKRLQKAQGKKRACHVSRYFVPVYVLAVLFLPSAFCLLPFLLFPCFFRSPTLGLSTPTVSPSSFFASL